VQHAEQQQPEQPAPEHITPLRVRVALAADQEDRHAEQHAEQRHELLVEEGGHDPPGGLRAPLERQGRQGGVVADLEGHGEGRRVDEQDAQHRQSTQHVQVHEALAGRHWCWLLAHDWPLHSKPLDGQATASARARMTRYLIDFDSTLVRAETLDVLAEIALADAPDRAARAEAVRALTERAMAGALPFSQALRERVSLLQARREHLPALVAALTERSPLQPAGAPPFSPALTSSWSPAASRR
jgi:hypothetical protein